jgi:hypothetical protein
MEQSQVQLQVTNPISLWNPTQLPLVQNWWRSDLGITLSSGQVSDWVDQISGLSVPQATAARQPDYTTSNSTFNGQPTLDFVAADQQFLSALAPIWSPGQDLTVITISSGSGVGTSTMFGSLNYFRVEASYSAATTYAIIRGFLTYGSNNYSTTQSGYTTNQPDIIVAELNRSGNGTGYLGQTYKSSLTQPAVIPNPYFLQTVQNATTFGARRFGGGSVSNYFTGSIAEVIVTKTALTAYDWQNLNQYIAYRYGIRSDGLATQQYLDLYPEAPILLNFQIDDYQELPVINSDFTRTFRIPATADNNRFFQNSFMINSVDYDVTKKVPAEIFVDGEFFRRGQIRLNKIFTNEFGDRTDYEIFFLGEGKDFASQIGEGFMNSLDCSNIAHNVTMTNIVDSWDASAGATGATGLLGGDVVYPLIDYGYTYSGATGTIEQSGSVAFAYVDKPFITSGDPLNRTQFKPWIRTKYLVDQIFAQTDYTYTSNFFDSTFFHGLYCNATGNTALASLDGEVGTDLFEVSTPEWQFTPSPTNVIQQIKFENGIDLDPGDVIPDLSTFTANNSGDHLFYFKIFLTNVYASLPATLPTFTFYVYKNITSQTLTSTGTFPPAAGQVYWVAGTGNIPYVDVTTGPGLYVDGNYYYELEDGSGGYGIEGYYTVNMNAGEQMTLRAKYTGTGALTFEVGGGPGAGFGVESIWSCESFLINLNNPCELLQDNIKIIDFFKSLINKFKLVVAPDPSTPYNLVVEPYNDYIGSGVVRDWTELLDTSYDFEISPIFFEQSATVKFFDQADADKFNALNLDKFKEPYGQYIYDSAQELLNGNRDVTGVFSPTLLGNLTGTPDGTFFILPRLIIEEPDNNLPNNQYAKVNPIRPNLRLCYYNGVQSTGGITWYYENDSLSAVGATGYALMSPYTDWPTTNNTINLNYEVESGYWSNQTQFPATRGTGIYDEYWSQFINDQYSPYARRFTGRFILDHYILKDFQFSDVIFVKDTYYRVLSIKDVPLGEEASVQVELLKLLNYVPPTVS